MSIHWLSQDVTKIVRRLSDLPGSKQLSVQAKRYPRRGSDGRTTGFDEQHWLITGPQEADSDLPIPADAEDVIVTWLGAPGAPQLDDQITQAVRASDEDAANWEYRVFTRAQLDSDAAPELVVQVFNVVGTRPA
jgi:hypothetical protein